MQDYPGAPGSARPGNPGTAVPAACGGAAVQSQPQAWDHVRSRAAPMPMLMPKARDHIRSRAASMPKAPPSHAACGPASAGPSVPLTTALVPAQMSRLLQVVLLRVPATPRTFTYPQSHSTTHQVHPALLAPTRPPPATASTGFSRQRHSRAPPPPAESLLSPVMVSPFHSGTWIPAHAGMIAAAHPLSTWWRGARGEARQHLTCRPCRRW